MPVDAKVDAILGDSAKAQVTIVEFSDFQCPFCSRAAKTVDQLVTDYGDKVRVVFKHKPLPFHQNAKPASAAAIAAGKQGKFWEFYHKAFDNQQNLTDENFVAWAKELGLDAGKFDADRKSDAVAKSFRPQGIEPLFMPPTAFAKYVTDETAKWAVVVEKAGMVK